MGFLKGGYTEVFLSTPSARRATKNLLREQSPDIISIHALREEGDTFPPLPKRGLPYFYPRPPRGGRHQGDVLT